MSGKRRNDAQREHHLREAEMAELFDDLDGRADQAATVLTEIFNLEEQRAAAEGAQR